ncbi:MAG: hypothetical protein GXO87_09150, partial [Chlorobi bacterium]|nr:hypothetical protein [Chlorobiota bacterium]
SGKVYSAIKEFKKNNRIIKFRAVKGVQLGGVDLLNAIKNEKRLPFEYVIADQKASNYSYEIFDNGVVQLNFPRLNLDGNKTYSNISEDVLSRLSLSDNTRDLLGIVFNSSSFLKSGNLFNKFLDDLNERNCWVATLGQISDRLKTRNNISAAFSILDNGDIEIVIENRNPKTVYDVQISLNEFFGNYQIKNENINGKYYQTDKKLTKLIINKIMSRQKEFIKLHKVNMVVKN